MVYGPGMSQMRYAGTRFFSKSVAVFSAVLLLSACASAFALDPASPVAQREAKKMRAVLEENFQACNEENLKKLLGTTSRFTGTPQQMAEFAAEVKQMFDDTDVSVRVVDVEPSRIQQTRGLLLGHALHAAG